MRMLKGPVHPTGTAGVWEKECTAVQRSWRCLALNSIVSGHSWYSQGHTWLCHWWQSHGWAARIDSLGNSRQTIISPERSRQVCRWLLPFSSRSVTSAFPSWCEGGSGSVVSDSDCLVPWYSYESKNCSSAGGEGAWMTNKLLVLVLKVGNDKNNCVVFVFLLSVTNRRHVWVTLLFEKYFKVYSQCCITGVWAGQEKIAFWN